MPRLGACLRPRLERGLSLVPIGYAGSEPGRRTTIRVSLISVWRQTSVTSVILVKISLRDFVDGDRDAI